MNAASRFLPFCLCCGGMMSLAIASNLPPVYFTTFAETFGGPEGLSDEQLGRIPAFVFAGLMVGIVVTGPLADRLGARPFVMGGLVLLCAGLALLGSAGNYVMLLAAVCLLGLGAGMLDVVLSPIVAALYPQWRASALNWLHAFYCIGAVCTVLIGSAALYLDISWRAVALGIIAGPVLILLGFAAVATPPLVHENAGSEPIRSLIRHRFVIATLVLICLGGAMEVAVAQWLPAYGERGLGYSKATAGAALAAFSVAMVAGRLLAGFLVRHVKALALLALCCAASSVLILLGCFFPSAPVALAACIGVGFTGSCFWPTTLGLAADRFPRGGASMFGLLAASGNAGCIVIPWLVGAIAGQCSLNWGLAMVTLCPLVMAVLLAGMAFPRQRDGGPETI